MKKRQRKKNWKKLYLSGYLPTTQPVVVALHEKGKWTCRETIY